MSTIRLQHVAFTLLIVSLASGLGSCAPGRTDGVNLSSGWRFRADPLGEGTAAGWFRPSWADGTWELIDAGAAWETQGFDGLDGTGWYRRTIVVSEPERRQVLFFRGVDDAADIWLNGTVLGSHDGSNEPFYFPLGDAANAGENVIAVRVRDDGGPGGITGDVILIPEERVETLFRTPYSDETARSSPDWVREAVIYEVYLRSFSREGTFEGLRRRIPELRDLGVTVVWLMPIHPIGIERRKGTLGSPYAVKDFYGINPEFGSEDDFRNLVRTVHENGMRIILDLVANHTSWDSKILNEHPEWFTADADGKIMAPNPDWSDVADLNYQGHELRKYMVTMMRSWVEDFDIDGFRADVAEMVPLDFWEQARAELERIKPVLMLAEGSLPEHHVGAFDMTYAWNTYHVLDRLLKGTLPPSSLATVLERERLAFPTGSLRLRFNSNHDENAWDAPAVTKLTAPGMRLTSVLMFTIPGVPLIYNGQEVGDTTRLALFEKVAIDWSDSSQHWPFYRNLARLRRDHPVFVRGAYEALPLPDSTRVFSYARTSRDETALVALNFAQDTVTVDLSVPLAATPPGREYFSGERAEASAGLIRARLEPRGFRVYLFER